MFIAPSLRVRRLQPEVMDDPSLDADAHHAALNALARINFLSASALIVWPSIRRLCRERQARGDSRPLRVLDIATGGGDVPIRLTKKARGRAIEFAGGDFSPVAIEHARANAAKSSANIAFFELDVLNGAIPPGYDVITCSLFLHHLDEGNALRLMANMRQSDASLLMINDLARGWGGWWAAYLGSRILTRSKVVHVDALLSVEGAFTPVEALALSQQAGWQGATVRRKFPFRYLLKWQRS